MQLSKYKTIGGILFSFLIVLGSLCVMNLFNTTKIPKVTIYFLSRIAIWLALFLVILYARFIEKQDFMLWKDTKFTSTEYISAFLKIFGSLFLVLFVFGIIFQLLHLKPNYNELQKLMNVFQNNILLAVFFCVTAGFTEELIFRSYLIPRLKEVFNNTTLAIIISSFLFGILHFGFGSWLQIVGPMLIGTVFAIHYCLYKNIKILIFCHIVWDLLILMTHINFKI
jgi:membrane protease YdiL (CAAX protease family)